MFVYVFQYFLKETNNFFWNFAWTFRAKYPVVLIHVHVQILISCFRTCHYTQGSFIEDLYLLLSIANFFFVLMFVDSHSVASHQCFYSCFWYYSEGCHTKNFSQHLFLNWEPFWGFFRTHFGGCFSVLESCSILSSEILHIFFLYYPTIQCAKTKIEIPYPSTGGLK